MKTLWVIPCCQRDETALMVAVQSIRDRMKETDPTIMLLTDPKDDGWHPRGGDYVVKGPPVVNNLQGSKWTQNFHDIVEDVLDMEDFTHWIKTDADVIWLNDRLPRLEGVFGYKGANNGHFCGAGYGFHVAAFREMRKEWLYPYSSTGEDLYTSMMVKEICTPFLMDGMEGMNWYRVTPGRLLKFDAIHCGQGYKKDWVSSRKKMGDAMFDLYCDYINIVKRREKMSLT